MMCDERNKMITKIMLKITDSVDEDVVAVFIEEAMSSYLDDLPPEDLQKTYKRIFPNE